MSKKDGLLKLAEAQLIGFTQASRGYSIVSLANSMGLTKSEWIKLRDSVDLKPQDKIELDKFYELS